MKEKLADMIFLSIRESRSIEELAERLVDRGVQIVPEGAMILTRAELDALNKYQERFKGQDAEAVDFVEVVRCKDCIYNSNGSCTHSEIYDDVNYKPDYYCADGERREE